MHGTSYVATTVIAISCDEALIAAKHLRVSSNYDCGISTSYSVCTIVSVLLKGHVVEIVDVI